MGNEQGSVTVFAVALMASIILITGLIYDGARLVDNKALVEDAAFSASRAAAAEHQFVDNNLIIDSPAATQRAATYLANVGVNSVSITTTASTATVTAERTYQGVILPFITDTHQATHTSDILVGVRSQGDTP